GPMPNESGVLVVGEFGDDALTGITAELLGAAHRVVDVLGGKASAALLGEGAGSVAPAAIAAGADRVYVAESPELTPFTPDAWVPALQQIVAEAGPAVVLIGQTSIGRDLGPHLAFRLGTGVAMDTLELTVRDGRVVMTRACFGGNAREEVVVTGSPQIATVRAKSQEPLEADAGRRGETVQVSLSLNPAEIKESVIERTKAKAEGVRLEDANIVVSGGRGLGAPEGFRLVEELAGVLGGAVGASRAACDLGWYPPSQQVGLTGKTVSPDLYVAVAISGASQHWAGMAGSKNVVAINKDPDANMVKAARFAVVGDYKQVLPALVEAVRELKN
ncbi:MAG TPA: electron transfer flavoprotein subunit alpha/FixB family protein, partial [Dehalococcoidia bacterium]|nr:electron transfer flavoprotein subunit alpha/FixB family protein [Dehalococcoidia bacterium]